MEIPRGEITKTVYSLIREEKYAEAVDVLEQLSEIQPNSRAASSLLAFCHYHMQNFDAAVVLYDQLSSEYPEVLEYRYLLALSMYHNGNFEEALTASYINSDACPTLQEKVAKLQAAIQYCRDDRADTKSLLDKCPQNDPDTDVSRGCLAYKEGKYSEARELFEKAATVTGMEPLLWYNRAVTVYQQGDYPTASHFVGEIIEHGALNFPELRVGAASEDPPKCVQSVGNSWVLQKSALVEALNLKAAFEFDLKKVNAAKASLKDLPPRLPEELDPVTLHNEAIISMQSDPNECCRKLQFLLSQGTFPPETFSNLLLIYWRYELFDSIADLLAGYEEYKTKFLSHNMQRFYEALIKRDVNTDEAVSEMEDLCTDLGKHMMELVKKVSSVKLYGNEEEIKAACNEFDEIVDCLYMPVLLTLSKIFWEKDELEKVEAILRTGAEYLDDRDAWLLNCAHVVFKRGQQFKEAAGLYELVARKFQFELMQVTAASLANLVVCYIHIGRNEEAEAMVRKIEEQEARYGRTHPDVRLYHSCILSLVIGILYCVKGNLQFGVARMGQALLDVEQKLGADTWFYVKSCILYLLEGIVKNRFAVPEQTILEAQLLLKKCEEHGRRISTIISDQNYAANSTLVDESTPPVPRGYGKETVAYEARHLQYMLYRVAEAAVF